jgi:citrate lyase beta subunit
MAPGDNSVLLRKQAASDADVAVICVEDAVLPQHKLQAVCTENLIRVADVMESLKLAE